MDHGKDAVVHDDERRRLMDDAPSFFKRPFRRPHSARRIDCNTFFGCCVEHHTTKISDCVHFVPIYML